MARKTSELSGTPMKVPTGYKQSYYNEKGVRRSVTKPTITEAVAGALEAVKATKQLTKRADPSVAFSALSERFLADSAAGRDGRTPLAHYTLTSYRNLLDNHVLPIIGKMKLIDITTDDVREVRDAAVRNTQRRASAIKIITVTKTILRYAVALDLLQSLPGSEVTVRMDWAVQQEIKDNRVPTMAEIVKLDAVAKQCYGHHRLDIRKAYERYYPFYILLRMTGMRSSEVIGLQWADFSDDFAKVKVRRRVSKPIRGNTQSARVSRPKTKNSLRTIPLAPALMPILYEWKQKCAPTKSGWVFPTKNGDPVSYYNMRSKFWAPLLTRAEVRPVGMHGIRHFFASMIIREGKVKEVATLLGHHSSSFTMDTYGHILEGDDDTMESIAEKMAAGVL